MSQIVQHDGGTIGNSSVENRKWRFSSVAKIEQRCPRALVIDGVHLRIQHDCQIGGQIIRVDDSYIVNGGRAGSGQQR